MARRRRSGAWVGFAGKHSAWLGSSEGGRPSVWCRGSSEVEWRLDENAHRGDGEGEKGKSQPLNPCESWSAPWSCRRSYWPGQPMPPAKTEPN